MGYIYDLYKARDRDIIKACGIARDIYANLRCGDVCVRRLEAGGVLYCVDENKDSGTVSVSVAASDSDTTMLEAVFDPSSRAWDIREYAPHDGDWLRSYRKLFKRAARAAVRDASQYVAAFCVWREYYAATPNNPLWRDRMESERQMLDYIAASTAVVDNEFRVKWQ